MAANLRSIRGDLREQLTVGERAFWWGMVTLILVLPPLAVGLLLFGGGNVRGVGIGLLFAAVIVFAVPVSPILRARVRRRQAAQPGNRHVGG